ncbi:MAG: MetQ/NlpA family ABC transporter substrate-binding protein [Marinobacter sp.]|nr:MetQ/NlpA family ABC transporter substrate-binding protein [Marinobacter sp.]
MKFKNALVALAAFASFSAAQAMEKISIAATPVPHAEILEYIKPSLHERGIDLDVRVFTDYVQPNIQVDQKRMHANFFQHQPYLTNFNDGRGTRLVSIAGIHIEPFGGYSSRIKHIDELAERATVAIPNDPTNGGRALLLLQQQGLITLKPEAGITATPRDIAENPKRLRFRELEAATLPRVLNQVDLALINTNYALEAGLRPSEDALFIEGAESPYVNILVVHADNADNASLQKLADTLRTEEVRRFIKEKYQGAVVPAF